MSTCPACGASLEGHWKFCLQCGAPLDRAATTIETLEGEDAAPAVDVLPSTVEPVEPAEPAAIAEPVEPAEPAAIIEPAEPAEPQPTLTAVLPDAPDDIPAAIRPGDAPADRAPLNALAVVALALGIVGGPVAIVFGHAALRQVRQTGERGRRLAIVATVLGYVWLAAWAGVLTWVLVSGVR